MLIDATLQHAHCLQLVLSGPRLNSQIAVPLALWYLRGTVFLFGSFYCKAASWGVSTLAGGYRQQKSGMFRNERSCDWNENIGSMT